MHLRSPIDRPSSRRAQRHLVIGAGTALLLCIAACGGASSNAPATSAPAQGTVTSAPATSAPASTASGGAHEFKGTLTVTGTVSQSTTFTQSLTYLPSCADLAKDGMSGQTWSIPQPSSQTFYLNWNVSPYTGPGTFTDPTLFEDSVEVDAPYQGTTDEFDQVDGTTLSITVNSDGSGSATFQNLQDGDQLPVSGTETWTCS
jgi:hypothetical protein